MRCIAINGAGSLVDVVPQPADVSACTLVVGSPAEMSSPLLQLDESGAADIAVAVMLLWAVAWGFRELGRMCEAPPEPRD